MDCITLKPFSWVTPSRNPRSLQIWSKSSLINPKPNENNRHLPSTSFTRRLRDFPSSAIPSAIERCDFSCPNLLKRCDFSCPNLLKRCDFSCPNLLKRLDFSCPNPFQRCDFSCPNPLERSEFSRSNPFRKRCRLSCSKRFDGPIRLPEREENGAHYYQSGGINMALWGPLLGAEPLLGKVGRCIRPFLAKLAAHPALVALTLALLIPVLLSLLVERERKWMRKWSAAFWMIFNNKGNLCSFWAAHFAITTWVAIHKGLSGAHFAFGCWYAFSTLLDDEFGLAWHRGFHAEIRNRIVEDIFQGRPIGHRKLKVLLGDPWLQIICGALLGILVASICCQGFMGAT